MQFYKMVKAGQIAVVQNNRDKGRLTCRLPKTTGVKAG